MKNLKKEKLELLNKVHNFVVADLACMFPEEYRIWRKFRQKSFGRGGKKNTLVHKMGYLLCNNGHKDSLRIRNKNRLCFSFRKIKIVH